MRAVARRADWDQETALARGVEEVLPSAVMTGGASLRLANTAIASLPFHDHRRTAMARGELKTGALRQR